MREIKFRAWNKQEKIMCYDDEDKSAEEWDGTTASNVEMVNSIFSGDFMSADDNLAGYEWMQYTGLKDKNGKEIYEGDIVKQHWSDSEKKNIGQVIYHDAEAMFLIDYPSGGGSVMNHSTLSPEVIGNIHENPELLK